MCRDYALEHGWRIVAQLAEDDRGASGASFELPELNRVLDMARAAEFEVLVVREIDRLSRNLAKQLIVEEELKQHGVQIEYVLGAYPDTPEGNLMKNVRASVAEYERLKISERMVRGRRNKVKAGNVLPHGRPPYGYRLANGNGKQEFVIHEPEACIVRLIFEWLTRGADGGLPLSALKIAARLTEMGIPTWADIHKPKMRKRGSYAHWYSTTVAKIIRCETYAGTWYYGQRNNHTHTDNPPEHWLAVEVPALVDEATWRAAQQQLDKNRIMAKRNEKHDFLMHRRARCGKCGCSMSARSKRNRVKLYKYYNCNSDPARTAHGRCGSPTFRADDVDDAVWAWVRSLVEDPSELTQGLDAYQEERDRETMPLRERLAVVDSLLTNNQAQLERLLDLYLSGELPREMLVDRKSRLERTIESLERERGSLAIHLEAETLSQGDIERIQQFVSEVLEGLNEAEERFETRRRIIEELDVQAILAVEDGKKVVYTRCMLGEKVLSVVNTTTRN
jgi:site-specific DNA recombinase